MDHRFLLTGDALYTIRHLAVDQVRAIQTWAKSYERATFDELANLNPARLPRFVPAGDGAQVGHAA